MTLELRDLEVAYGGVAAVRGLSLSVAPGEIVGLIGPNGAGKSTTLHAIMGLVPARGGEIRFGDRSLRGRSPESIARSGIALVPEGRRLFAELTVEENLRLGLAARPRANGSEDAIAEVVELFPIVEEFRHRHAGALSGGQQQQLAIARALVAKPSILLLDEPSLGLAPTIVDLVFSTLRTISERGIGVLLVEQRAQRTVALADRTHVLANGELRLTLTPDDAADTDRMVAAYSRDDRERSHRLRPRRARPAGAGRRDRARRGLRAHGGRDRPRLRRDAARQLRVRAADHGRRVRARVRVGSRLAGRRRHRALLRGRARALARDGARRLPAAAHAVGGGDAHRDLRGRVPAAVDRAALVRAAREDGDLARPAEPAGRGRRASTSGRSRSSRSSPRRCAWCCSSRC